MFSAHDEPWLWRGCLEQVWGDAHICRTPPGTPRCRRVSSSVNPPVAPSGVRVTLQTGRPGSDRPRSEPGAWRSVCSSTRPLFVLSSASHLHVFVLLQGQTRMLSGVYWGWGWGVEGTQTESLRTARSTRSGLSSLSSQPPHLHVGRWAATSRYSADCSRSFSTDLPACAILHLLRRSVPGTCSARGADVLRG